MIDLKLLWRDWRGGQLNLVVSALVLAVMVVTAVSLFADRVERGLNQQISSFLAADLALSGGIEISDEYRQQADTLGLQVAETVRFRSMVFAGNRNHLAAVKAVDHAYPLRGEMELSATLDAEQVITRARGPESGEAWVEARLLNLLDIQLGDTVEVGYVQLKITHLIVNEPDRGTGFSGTGARLMMSTQDLAASQLIRPGGRYSYRLLMRGDAPALKAYSDWFEQQQEALEAEAVPHYRLLTPENAEEQLSEALQRGRAFLLLSGTIGVLLAGLAMALASQRYASRLTDQVALMKAWGQSSASIRRSQFFRLFMIAAVATVVGVALGWFAHYLLLEVVRGVLDVVLPLPGWRPWLVATITGFVCVLGFALPALWHLPRIEPLRVLRRDLPDTLIGQGRRLLIGIGALLLLAYWYSGSLVVATLFLVALFALFAVCALVAMQILRLVRGFGSWRGSYTRLGLANLWRRRGQTLVQLVGFSTTLMLLLVVTGMRTNLIAEWEAQLPDTTPSHFVFNVSTPQVEPVKALLDGHGVTTTDWYPMVRGRLVAINGEAISRERMARSDGLSREVNFTQTENLPEGNELVAGEWWAGTEIASAPRAEFSIEEEVATEIGLVLGDEVEFSIGGLRFSAEVTSIRSVNWQSMTPNFYVVFYPGLLDKYSPNWITAVRGGDDTKQNRGALVQQAPFVQAMVKQFPTAVVLELRDVIERIRDVINRVTQGLELILFAVLACGGLVLFAAIGVSFDERMRENAILRTLGSSRRIIVGALTVEFATLGLIAGLIAACGAEIVLYFVQTNLFDLSPQWHWDLWLLGLVSGVGLITALGLLRSRPIISTPPLESLRQLA
ncbi:inner membrane transport permease [Arenicella chitinivorans]|uniref:Inner membrane transport permease n=1 Tax=Arenicella chitinivorans TaxID=1329800 RepID=A0A918VQR1_9GAMM|nr:FtsX-like permease family protein [Arenicella chitinivorans]GHA19958.1 inner membrane transport permease [Arenicella chitinivorans]